MLTLSLMALKSTQSAFMPSSFFWRVDVSAPGTPLSQSAAIKRQWCYSELSTSRQIRVMNKMLGCWLSRRGDPARLRQGGARLKTVPHTAISPATKGLSQIHYPDL